MSETNQDERKSSSERPGVEQSLSHYVGIGASAGGLEAIEAFFKNAPADTGLAFIVVQHLSPDYKSLMVELLSKKTAMKVLRAEDGMAVRPNHVYLIPPKKNLTIFHGKLLLKAQGHSHAHGINLPIDIFLRSLADDQGERAVAVILSGTGSDGTRGVRAVKERNGMVMVQDEQSAKFDGMPRAAISTGVADFVLPPSEMPLQLIAYVKHPYRTRQESLGRLQAGDDARARIFAELREKTSVDFTHYKASTIVRRIERRMVVCQSKDLDDYVRYLYTYPGEVMALYRELLIGVTSFFRDPETMSELQHHFLPALLDRARGREVRFWVAGCSTGEEAYTLGILAKEAMETHGLNRDVKIFATDIDRDAIMTAGVGVFAESIAADMSPRLLAKYFYHKGDCYQVARNIREMVVFAQHNLVKDPPFTKVDLVSCRNLLIYLEPVLQQKALRMFNFSLNPEGILLLGSSETVGDMVNYFKPLHQKFRIFQAEGKQHPQVHSAVEMSRIVSSPDSARNVVASSIPTGRPTGRETDWMINGFLEVLSRQYVPLAVVVNERMEMLYVLGDTEGFFKLPTGRTVYDISKMALKDLAIPLATGVQKVFRNHEALTYTGIRLRYMDETRTVRMRIEPLPTRKGHETLAAVFLEIVKEEATPSQSQSQETFDVGEEAHERIKDLELDLQFTKENLQATIEELETSNEELQATNEELLASNEELQSTNEELQSTNEELFTVNSEYQNKINELTEMTNDVDNLLTSSSIGTLLLDEDLVIRKFSREVEKIFLIVDRDVGRPITHLAHRLSEVDPLATIRRVREHNGVIEEVVHTEDGVAYMMRVLPYHIAPNAFSGVVVTFVDITRLKRAEETLVKSHRKSEDIIRYMPAGLFVYELNSDGELIFEQGNPEAERITGVVSADLAGRRFDDIWAGARENGLTARFVKVAQTGTSCLIDKMHYEDKRVRGEYRILAFALPDNRLAVSFEDMTEQDRMQRELAESEARYRKLFETMAEGVVYQGADGRITSANPSAERILGLSLEQMQGRTSKDPRWKAIREDGSELPGEDHPAMVALRTGMPVTGFIQGIHNPVDNTTRWILANSIPEFREGEDKPYQVYSTFEDITERYQHNEIERQG